MTIKRPWDKSGPRSAAFSRKRSGVTTTTTTTPKSSSSTEEDANATDGIRVNGVIFQSDRFYLNDNNNNNNHSPWKEQNDCHCGGGGGDASGCHPPPLFSRSHLVESLQLKAAVIGTYTFEMDVFKREFPSLFGKQDHNSSIGIPTFVIHGKKGWNKQKTTRTQIQYTDDDDDDESLGSETAFVSDPNNNNDDSMTQEGKEVDENDNDLEKLPETVHFAEITTTWMEERPRSFRDAIDPDTGWIQSEIVQRRSYKPGVHHPKFMILFETSGSVVVVISTANFTNPNASIDASWVQRFFPSSSALPNKPSSFPPPPPPHGNDFGSALVKFLEASILATAPNQWTLHAFVRKYLGWKSILDLERNFDFTKAQVHLVPTIPGNYQIHNFHHHQQQQTRKRQPKSSNPSNTITGSIQPPPKTRHYGPQRVAEIIWKRQYSEQRNILMTDRDRLLFQPTSLGAEWNIHTMSQLVRTYLGLSDNSNNNDGKYQQTVHNDTETGQNDNYSDAEVLDRMDIIWPTEPFVRRVCQSIQRPGWSSPSKNAYDSSINSRFRNNGSSSLLSSNRSDLEHTNNSSSSSGILFLSSTTFNKIDLSCLSRMAMYEPSTPSQSPNILPPHFKSVARLLYTHRDKYNWIQRSGIPHCQEYFSWFLLTSACLSRGAQGEKVIVTPQKAFVPQDEMSYSNFELGVLFLSDLVGDKSSSRRRGGRIYGWRPSQCTCRKPSTSSSSFKVIHLPCPYNVRPPSYVDDPDQVEFCEMPFLHEILPESARIGHMRMTPYGAELSRKCEKNSVQVYEGR